MVEEGKHYFLSRPRRFGKSLFLDTLKELFEGNEPLFEGLSIHDHWDWSVRHPVVRLDFGSGRPQGPDGLQGDTLAQLDTIAAAAGVEVRYESAEARFRHLLQALHERSGRRVAVLVDEYDKPILDALETPAAARANRDYLHGLYSTIKSSDAHVRFTLLTGVSKFSKVSLFSGLNNLKDVTLDPRFSAVCGYTEADLDTVFAPELPGLDRDALRDWYNGYGWLVDERVYNPFDILLLFDRRQFEAWWFETGTPSFLVDLLARRRIGSASLDSLLSRRDLLSTFDVDDIATEALLFQTGYLTIHGAEPRGGTMYYRLGYPNREVRQSLNESLLRRLTGRPASLAEHTARLYDLLLANDSKAWRRCFVRSWPASPTSGTRGTTSPATRATTRACSTRASPRSAWTSPWRTAAATAASTWRCASTATFTSSSSRCWTGPRASGRARRTRRRRGPRRAGGREAGRWRS